MSEQTHRLGEVLRGAREAKGVDLERVERETKIREHYLAALERGEYRELPGAVYTRGFLRNYGLYLGLDPEYLIDLYRLETAAVSPERLPPQTPPRPIGGRRPGAVLTPNTVVAAVLTLGVAALIAWLGWEFVTFARTPDLRVTEPPGNVSSFTGASYLVRGVTEEGATVTVDGPRENPTVTADENGSFSLRVELTPGSNVLEVRAVSSVTRRESAPVSRTITVTAAAPSPEPVAALSLDQPTTETSTASPVVISGRSSPGATISIEAVLAQPAPAAFTVTDGTGASVPLPAAGTSAPAPLQLTATTDGTFAGELALPPGTWELRATAPPLADAVTRQVTVAPPGGLVGTLSLSGGDSYLELEQDDVAAEISGSISRAGDSVPLSATETLRVRAGNAAAVTLVVNGLELGAMGAPAVVVEWRITYTGG